MGTDTKGFIHSENAKNFNNADLFRYLDKKYGVNYMKPADDNMMVYYFSDGDDKRTLYVFDKYKSYTVEDFPKFKNTAGITSLYKEPYIVRFDLGCWGMSDEIIKGIVSHFGGGYFIHNDCGGDWETVE